MESKENKKKDEEQKGVMRDTLEEAEKTLNKATEMARDITEATAEAGIEASKRVVDVGLNVARDLGKGAIELGNGTVDATKKVAKKFLK